MIRIGCSTLLTLLASAGASGMAPIPLHIDAQPVDRALRDFVIQSGVQVLFLGDDSLEGLRAQSVHGTVGPTFALEQLLTGTGLTYEFVNPRTVAVRAASALTTLEASGEGGSDGGAGGNPAPESYASAAHDKVAGSGIPEVLVKGSQSLNADIERTPDDVRPYVVLSRETIEKSGARNAEDFLRKELTMNYVQKPNNQNPGIQSTVGDSSIVALRGLVGTETLILIDGRRATTRRSGGNELQTDLNSIPLSAIERIEVLPSSAAGIYGGNATGGVVNVILRRNYTGVESTISYTGSMDGGGNGRGVDLFAQLPVNTLRSSLQVSGSFSDSAPLLLGDRDFYTRRRQVATNRRIASDPEAYYTLDQPPLGSTTNIQSADGSNLMLKPEFGGQILGSTITSVPLGYSGAASDGGAGLAANAGHYNLNLAPSEQAYGTRSAIIGSPQTTSISATIRTDLSQSISSFLQLGVARRDYEFPIVGLNTLFYIPSSSLGNPFAQDIWANVPLTSQNTRMRNRSDDQSLLVGLNFNLGSEWSSVIDYTLSKSSTDQVFPSPTLSDEGQAAVGSGALDVLQNPANYAAQLVSFKVPEAFSSPTTARLDTISLRVAGPVFEIPTGKIVLSATAEDRRQKYGPWTSTYYQSDGSEISGGLTEGASNADSAYVEVRVPIASDQHHLLGLRKAELQIAARYESSTLHASYDPTNTIDLPQTRSFGSIDPSVGLRFEPARDLTFRASYGEGFLPPYLAQLQPAVPFNLPGFVFGLVDPKRGDEPISGLLDIRGGGNANLLPERSKSKSAGIILTPRAVPNLRVSFDWTRIDKRENIYLPVGKQAEVDEEDALPGLVVREAAAPGDPYGIGRIVGLNLRWRNATRSLSTSYDLTVDYGFDIEEVGQISFRGMATRLVHSAFQLSAVGDLQEYAGTSGFPQWAATAAATWARRGLSVRWSTRYLDSYSVNLDHAFDAIQNSDHAPSTVIHDVVAEYEFDQSQYKSQLLSGLFLKIGIDNVFNAAPHFFSGDRYLYDPSTDPRMATYFMSLRKRF